MNKETMKTAAKFAGGVLAVLVAAKLVKAYVAPKTPESVQKVLAFILP